MRAKVIPDLVRRLVSHEAGESQDQESLIEAAERVADKLRVHLSRRIGQEGYRTLLARALALTTAEFPRLISVQVGKDGSLLGLRESAGPDLPTGRDNEGNQDAVEGMAALLARFLELLATLIGEDLTLRMLGSVWPELALDDATGGENEKL